MKKSLKSRIEKEFEEGRLDQIADDLQEYRKECPYDRDLWFYECIEAMSIGDLELAQQIIEKCLRNFPTSYEAYYYQACIYQEKGEILDALKNYLITDFLCIYFKMGKTEIYRDTEEQIKILQPQFEASVQNTIEDGNNSEQAGKMLSFIDRSTCYFGKYVTAPRNIKDNIVGKEYWVEDDEQRYVGIYRAPVQHFIGEENMNLIRTQAEFLKYRKCGTDTQIIGETEEYLQPIASAEEDNIHFIKENGKIYSVPQRDARHFNYYRVKKGTLIKSGKNSYYGYPVPLGHSPKRRKLVLSFFVDGLAQEVINGPDFEKLMPNTYQFFKKGTICTNAFSCSEWTFPSLATYESGLNTLHHMMFHGEIDGELPKTVPTLSQYMKKAGYYTCKLDGDWRCIYSYGFARGVDQYIYHIQSMGARAEQEIMNVIEHLETFKETDQYLWMTVGDLHDVADGLDLSLAVQKNLTLEERSLDDKGLTSVKQKYSPQKSMMYKKTIQYFDMLFGFLYSYIQNNYKENEIVISLFADHGQGYLVSPDKNFLSKERTKVAFMFRGDGVKEQITDEMISTADYVPIMCKLAGIEMSDAKIDGRLPKAFGGKERKYTITESLHPGDVYTAVANTKEYEIYFVNSEATDNEGRFHLRDYKVYGLYRDGEKVEDEAILKEYENIFIGRIREHIIYE